MNAYADSNFFTRLYLPLKESDEARALMTRAERAESGALPITWLHRVEVTNALQLHVFSGASLRQTRVTLEQGAAAHAHFRDDLARNTFLRRQEANPATLERQFEELSLRHTAKYGFRTYDLLHVASALIFDCDTFWSFDTKASRLAKLEGLEIRN